MPNFSAPLASKIGGEVACGGVTTDVVKTPPGTYGLWLCGGTTTFVVKSSPGTYGPWLCGGRTPTEVMTVVTGCSSPDGEVLVKTSVMIVVEVICSPGVGKTVSVAGTPVIGQMVVEIGMVTVTTSPIGHFVTTVGGQLVMVETMVVKIVEVVKPAPPSVVVAVGGKKSVSVGAVGGIGSTVTVVGGPVKVVFWYGAEEVGMTIGPPVPVPVGMIPVGKYPVPVIRGTEVVLKN